MATPDEDRPDQATSANRHWVRKAAKYTAYGTPIGPIWIAVQTAFQLVTYVIVGMVSGLQSVWDTARGTPTPSEIRDQFWLLKNRDTPAAREGLKVIRNTFILTGLLVIALLVAWGIVSPLLLLFVGLPILIILIVGIFIALRG